MRTARQLTATAELPACTVADSKCVEHQKLQKET